MTGANNATLSDPKFWTVKETASLMRVSVMTVYRLVQNKELESSKIGRAIRIPEQSIRSYLGVPEPDGLLSRLSTH